jgi:hypothetical protein
MAEGGQPRVPYKYIQTHRQDAIDEHLSEECYPVGGVKGWHDYQDKKRQDQANDFRFGGQEMFHLSTPHPESPVLWTGCGVYSLPNSPVGLTATTIAIGANSVK